MRNLRNLFSKNRPCCSCYTCRDICISNISPKIETLSLIGLIESDILQGIAYKFEPIRWLLFPIKIFPKWSKQFPRIHPSSDFLTLSRLNFCTTNFQRVSVSVREIVRFNFIQRTRVVLLVSSLRYPLKDKMKIVYKLVKHLIPCVLWHVIFVCFVFFFAKATQQIRNNWIIRQYTIHPN